VGIARERQRQAAKDLSRWVVGFFDLMGYRRQLLAIDGAPATTERERAEVVRRLEEASGRRDLLVNGAKQVFDENRKRVAAGPTPEIAPGRLYDFLRFVDIRTNGFGDSVFLEANLDDPKVNPLAALHNIVNCSINMLIAHMAFLDSPVRGGVEMGNGIVRQGGLYSPATAQAVVLEKLAGFPRVLVGERLYGYLREEASSTDPARSTIAAYILGVIYEDPDDQLRAIDYLGATARRSFTIGIKPDHVRKIWAFACRSRARFTETKEADRKLADYYQKLCGYIEPRLRLWGLPNAPA
jgi:hypothetical protein